MHGNKINHKPMFIEVCLCPVFSYVQLGGQSISDGKGPEEGRMVEEQNYFGSWNMKRMTMKRKSSQIEHTI